MNFRLVSLSIIFFLQACQGPKPTEPKKFALTETLSRDKQLVAAETSVVENELVLTGKITFNENKVARVFPLAGGFVKELHAELGDLVKKGQILAVIRSPEIAGFTQEGQVSLARVQLAQKNAEVAEELFKSGNISEVQLLNAQKDLERAKSDLQKATEILELYGAGDKSIYPIKSPMSGYVLQKNIALNMELRTEDISPVFIVGSIDEVWAMANLYESDISKVKEGFNAEITTISYPDKTYKGKIDKIFNILDPQSRVLKARITLQNNDLDLKPEMFARVVVRYKGLESKVTVPSRALIFDKNKYFVMIYRADDDIETREVEIHKEQNGTAYLVRGVKVGEKVMTKYQLLVYDALND